MVAKIKLDQTGIQIFVLLFGPAIEASAKRKELHGEFSHRHLVQNPFYKRSTNFWFINWTKRYVSGFCNEDSEMEAAGYKYNVTAKMAALRY